MRQIVNKTRQLGLLLTLLALTSCAEDVGLDQYGQKVPVDRLADQWLIINYWAQWCAPCRKEIPELNGLAQSLEHQPIRILGVNFDGLQAQPLQQASEEMQIEFTVLAQDPAERYGLTRATVLPVTYIIGPDGQLKDQLLGEQTAEGLQEKLKQLGALGTEN